MCLKHPEPCQYDALCNTSDYGLTHYTRPDNDPRFITPIPRGSRSWKLLFNKRTSTERVNDRLLIDYGLESSHTRGKMRFSFWALIHAFNIHLDAWIKVLAPDSNPIYSLLTA